MSKLYTSFNKSVNRTTTTNGMAAFDSTDSHLLDLFYSGYSYRDNPNGLEELVNFASAENLEKTLKILFYLRAIRGNNGCGERDVFRNGIRFLMKKYEDTLVSHPNFLEKISKYGRWDDLVHLYGISKKWDYLISGIIIKQLKEDIYNYNNKKQISLLCKWLPSINTSSKETRNLAKTVCDNLFVRHSVYRKILSKLRSYLKIVEHNLMEKDYASIDYSSVPSKAMMKYRNAFSRNDNEHYSSYLKSVSKGEDKINSSTLFPHEIVEKFSQISSNNKLTEVDYLNESWKALPNYFSEKAVRHNWLPVIDLSESMRSRTSKSVVPLYCAIAMGIYISERNNGIFKNEVMSFATKPRMFHLSGDTLFDKLKCFKKIDVGYSTNLEAIYDSLLWVAKKNNISVFDMPETIIMISDMQFNEAIDDEENTAYEMIREKYRKAGYHVPKLVFWNVAAQTSNVPALADENGVILVGGYKPSSYEEILSSTTPLDFMNKVLENFNDISIG